MRKAILIFLFVPFYLYGQKLTGPIIATFHGVTNNGSIYKEDVSINDSIDIYVKDCKYANAKVLSFGLSFSGPGWDGYESSISNKVTAQIVNIIKHASIGQSLYIENIKVQVNDTIIEVSPIKLKIDGLKTCIYSNFNDYDLFLLGDTGNYRFGTSKDARKFHIGTDPIFGFNNKLISRKVFFKNHRLHVYDSKENCITGNYSIKEYTITLTGKRHNKTFTGKGNIISSKIKRAVRWNRNLNEIHFQITKATDTTGKEVEIGGLWLEIK